MELLLETWGQIVARWPLVIVVAWVVLVVAALRFSPALGAVAQQQNLSSLPASAPASCTRPGLWPGSAQPATRSTC